MEKLNEVAEFLERNPGLADCVVQITYSEMHDIAEAFRELERRAEAAEANYLNEVDYAKQLKNNYRAIEAKLAELEKQQPMAYRWESPANGKICYDGIKPLGVISQPLYLRPAPAINLTEMVPDGWKLVPVEPNWEMLSADGCKEHHNGQPCLHHDNRKRIWSAMLAAAPNLPQ